MIQRGLRFYSSLQRQLLKQHVSQHVQLPTRAILQSDARLVKKAWDQIDKCRTYFQQLRAY